MLKQLLFIVLFSTGTLTAAYAQTGSDKGQLEKERQEIQNELRQMQDMYNNVKGKTKLSLRQLNILKKKISLQERYINSINKELKMIDDDIYLSNLEIYRLQRQLDTLKAQYARTIVYAYKHRSNYDYVNFIFSANSFNDAIKRVSYLKSYRAYREKQVTTILETQQLIAKRQQQQLGRKAAEDRAKAPVTNPVTNPTTTTSRPTTATKKPESYLNLNASDVKLNGQFEQNKGKLPWPVDNGFVAVHFGPYTIEGTKLKDNNPGVTIATPNAGGSVKAVFDGEVAAIHNYGDGVAVVIRHGKYFTSYSNLSGVTVSKGTEVKTGQVIGRVGEAQDGGGGQVDFMLMIESKNVNPEQWLHR